MITLLEKGLRTNHHDPLGPVSSDIPNRLPNRCTIARSFVTSPARSLAAMPGFAGPSSQRFCPRPGPSGRGGVGGWVDKLAKTKKLKPFWTHSRWEGGNLLTFSRPIWPGCQAGLSGRDERLKTLALEAKLDSFTVVKDAPLDAVQAKRFLFGLASPKLLSC